MIQCLFGSSLEEVGVGVLKLKLLDLEYYVKPSYKQLTSLQKVFKTKNTQLFPSNHKSKGGFIFSPLNQEGCSMWCV